LLRSNRQFLIIYIPVIVCDSKTSPEITVIDFVVDTDIPPSVIYVAVIFIVPKVIGYTKYAVP